MPLIQSESVTSCALEVFVLFLSTSSQERLLVVLQTLAIQKCTALGSHSRVSPEITVDSMTQVAVGELDSLPGVLI